MIILGCNVGLSSQVVEFYYRLIRNADYLVSAQHNSSEEGSGNSSDVEGSADGMDISDESALFEVIFSYAITS
jgi:hypothetical protein